MRHVEKIQDTGVSHVRSRCCQQLLVAFSPLIALGFVLMSAFESKEEEDLKRRKKGDFEMEGHAE